MLFCGFFPQGAGVASSHICNLFFGKKNPKKGGEKEEFVEVEAVCSPVVIMTKLYRDSTRWQVGRPHRW